MKLPTCKILSSQYFRGQPNSFFKNSQEYCPCHIPLGLLRSSYHPAVFCSVPSNPEPTYGKNKCLLRAIYKFFLNDLWNNFNWMNRNHRWWLVKPFSQIHPGLRPYLALSPSSHTLLTLPAWPQKEDFSLTSQSWHQRADMKQKKKTKFYLVWSDEQILAHRCASVGWHLFHLQSVQSWECRLQGGDGFGQLTFTLIF